MKKRYKLIRKKGMILILFWQNDGKLFGPDWEVISAFADHGKNFERCTTIIRLMNECDKHTNIINND